LPFEVAGFSALVHGATTTTCWLLVNVMLVTCAGATFAHESTLCGGEGGSGQIALQLLLWSAAGSVLDTISISSISEGEAVFVDATANQHSKMIDPSGLRQSLWKAFSVTVAAISAVLSLLLLVIFLSGIGGILLFFMPGSGPTMPAVENVLILPFLTLFSFSTLVYKGLSQFNENMSGGGKSKVARLAQGAMMATRSCRKNRGRKYSLTVLEQQSKVSRGANRVSGSGQDELDSQLRAAAFCNDPWEQASNRRSSRLLSDAIYGRMTNSANNEQAFVKELVHEGDTLFMVAAKVAKYAGMNTVDPDELLTTATSAYVHKQGAVSYYTNCSQFTIFLFYVALIFIPGIVSAAKGQHFLLVNSGTSAFVFVTTLLFSLVPVGVLVSSLSSTMTTLAQLRQLADKLLPAEKINIHSTTVVARWSSHVNFVLEVVKREMGGHHGHHVFGATLATVVTSVGMAVWVLTKQSTEGFSLSDFWGQGALWVLVCITVTYMSMLALMLRQLFWLDRAIEKAIDCVRDRSFAAIELHDMTDFLIDTQRRYLECEGKNDNPLNVAKDDDGGVSTPRVRSTTGPSRFRKPSFSVVGRLSTQPGYGLPVHQIASPNAVDGSDPKHNDEGAARGIRAMVYASSVASSWKARYSGIQLSICGTKQTVTLSAAYFLSVGFSVVSAALGIIVRFIVVAISSA